MSDVQLEFRLNYSVNNINEVFLTYMYVGSYAAISRGFVHHIESCLLCCRSMALQEELLSRVKVDLIILLKKNIKGGAFHYRIHQKRRRCVLSNGLGTIPKEHSE